MIKTLKALKSEYGDLNNIKSYNDLKSLAVNFIRMVIWKKEREHEMIISNYYHIVPYIINDIREKSFKVALKQVKDGNLHKSLSISYLYNYYGLDYELSKLERKKAKKTSL